MCLPPALLSFPSNSLQNSQALGFVSYTAKKHVLLSACALCVTPRVCDVQGAQVCFLAAVNLKRCFVSGIGCTCTHS